MQTLMALYEAIHSTAQEHLALVLLANALTTFALAFAKAFQSRNIVLGHYWSAYITSWGVTTLEVTNVSLIVVGGWWLILSAGFGGSLGCIAAMALHEKYFMKRKLAKTDGGERGISAYEQWQQLGGTGSEADFIASFKGGKEEAKHES